MYSMPGPVVLTDKLSILTSDFDHGQCFCLGFPAPLNFRKAIERQTMILADFISREPSTEYIQAVEESELLVISHHDFFHLRKTIAGWDKMYIYILEYGLTVITSRLNSLLTQNAIERYRNLLKNNPELVQRLSNSNLAAYLNISPETLSRLKSHI